MNNDCIANMKNLVERYHKKVMMCEIGINWNYAEAEAFYTDFITKAKKWKDAWESLPGNLNAMEDGKVTTKVCSPMKVVPPVHSMHSKEIDSQNHKYKYEEQLIIFQLMLPDVPIGLRTT